MDPRSGSASTDYMGFDTMSSGSIAATTSSGYMGVTTDDTEPDITFLSNLFPKTYSSSTRDHLLLSLFWLHPQAPIRLPTTAQEYEPQKYQGGSYLGQYPTQFRKSELFTPLSDYTYGDRKGQYQLNAPGYLPPKKEMKDMVHVSPSTYAISPDERRPQKSESVEILRMELNFKELANKTLSDKLKALPAPEIATPNIDNHISMPKNYYHLFRDLTRTLKERTQELEDTKARLEAVLVGLVMNKDSSVSTDGTFDPQELAHRITTKLQTLHSENQTLLRMVSHGNKQSLLVEMGLLKSENTLLREKVEALEKSK